MSRFRCFRPGWGMTEANYEAIEAHDAEDAAIEYAERHTDGPDYPDQVSVIDSDGVCKTFNITTEIDVIYYAHEAD